MKARGKDLVVGRRVGMANDSSVAITRGTIARIHSDGFTADIQWDWDKMGIACGYRCYELELLCKNCGHREEDHMENGRCLFGTGRFE